MEGTEGEMIWKEWARHTIKELERFDKQLEGLRLDINKVNLDITKLGYLNNQIIELQNKISELKEQIGSQKAGFEETIENMENESQIDRQKIEEIFKAHDLRIRNLEELTTKWKTTVYIIGAVLAAMIGMLSINIKDIFHL